MKQLFLILSALFISNFLTAQKNFEGTVTYNLHSGTGDKTDAELKVIFGKRKIKLLFKQYEQYEKDAVILFLDSATAYNVDFTEKTYKKRILTFATPPQKTENKMIAGYSTTSFQPDTNTGLGDLIGGYMGRPSAIFYLADSLFYDIPDILTGTKELVMVQQHKIVLRAEIKLKTPDYGIYDSASRNITLITAEAVEIVPMAINENEFFITADFVERKDLPDPVFTDSVMVVDTTVKVPAKKTVKKKPAKPAQRKSTSTPKAAIRKD
jgi:hypothetical protein